MKKTSANFSMLVILGAFSLVSVACPDASPMQKRLIVIQVLF